MRPRSYGILNRSIARGVSYALRDSNRKKYKRNIQNDDDNNTEYAEISFTTLFGIYAVIGLTWLLIALAIEYPILLLVYLITYIFYKIPRSIK